jgi:hypothetical protein
MQKLFLKVKFMPFVMMFLIPATGKPEPGNKFARYRPKMRSRAVGVRWSKNGTLSGKFLCKLSYRFLQTQVLWIHLC